MNEKAAFVSWRLLEEFIVYSIRMMQWESLS
jgi:hypothetical protein